MLDMAIYHFDQLRGAIGFEPVEVTAKSGIRMELVCRATPLRRRYSARGRRGAVYTGSWVSQGWQTTWDGDWRIQGSEGELHWADNPSRSCRRACSRPYSCQARGRRRDGLASICCR